MPLLLGGERSEGGQVAPLMSINLSENGLVNLIIVLVAMVIILWLVIRAWDLLGALFRRLSVALQDKKRK